MGLVPALMNFFEPKDAYNPSGSHVVAEGVKFEGQILSPFVPYPGWGTTVVYVRVKFYQSTSPAQYGLVSTQEAWVGTGDSGWVKREVGLVNSMSLDFEVYW